MKRYHENQVTKTNLDKPGTPPSAQNDPSALSAPLADPSAVSRGGLMLFRLIERLSRRLGYAHVRVAPSELRPGKSLAEMLGKCARHVRRLLGELLALGWIARQCDGRMVYLSPLVQLPQAVKLPRVPAPKGSFFAGKMSGLMSGLKRENVRSRHLYHTTETDRGDNNKTRSAGESPEPSQEPCSVAVSLLSSLVTPHEAHELAREASRQKLTEEQVRRVIAAYKGQLANIRNRGAWLREALRRGFAPPAPVSDHASDNGGRPVRVIAAPAEYRKLAQTLPEKPAVASQTAILAAPATSGGTKRTSPDLGRIQARIEALKAMTTA